MNKLSFQFLLFSVFGFIFLISPIIVLATECCIEGIECHANIDRDSCINVNGTPVTCEDTKGCPGYVSPTDERDTSNNTEEREPGSAGKFPNPFGTGSDASDPRVLIGRVIKAVLGLVGSLALIMFIWGGLMWMTSGGNTDKLTKGRNTLVWAALGLAVIFASYALVSFVIANLTKATL